MFTGFGQDGTPPSGIAQECGPCHGRGCRCGGRCLECREHAAGLHGAGIQGSGRPARTRFTRWRARVEARYRIVASRRARYLEMFKGLAEPALPRQHLPSSKDLIKQVLDQALTLEREDRIMWYLRRWRDGLFLQAYWPGGAGKRDPDLTAQGLETNLQLLKKRLGPESTYPAKLNEFTAVQSQKFWRDLQHFLGNAKTNGFTGVLDFKFPPDMKPHDLLDHLKRLEGADLEKSPARLLEPDDDEREITFPDGWAWWRLDRASCRQEGQAMRHCGNTASPRAGDQILSLREPVKRGGKTFWKPHATFILNNGTLGEMKGYGNQKPGAKLHPYIVKLLESDLVKMVNGGGYAPDQNFALSDLTAGPRDELLKRKPALAGLLAYYKIHGADDLIKTELNDRLGTTKPVWTDHGLLLDEFTDLKSLAQAMNDDPLENAAGFLEGDRDSDDLSGGYSDIPTYEVEAFYSQYQEAKPDHWKKIQAYVFQHHHDEILQKAEDGGLDLDALDATDIDAQWLAELDLGEFNGAAKSAISDAMNQAAERDLSRRVEHHLAQWPDLGRARRSGRGGSPLSLDIDHSGPAYRIFAPVEALLAELDHDPHASNLDDRVRDNYDQDKFHFPDNLDTSPDPKQLAEFFDWFEENLPKEAV